MARSKHVPDLDTVQDGLLPRTSHPDYVAVAPELFWYEDDPRARFGSDDSHDTLGTLQGHFVQGGGEEHIPGCISSLVADWALVPETIWDSSQQESSSSEPDAYGEKLATTRQVVAAAPEPPKNMQLRMYRAVGS